MCDLVDGEWRHGLARTLVLVSAKLILDALDPLAQYSLRPGVQRWKRAHDPGLALRDYEFRPGNDKHRCANQG